MSLHRVVSRSRVFGVPGGGFRGPVMAPGGGNGRLCADDLAACAPFSRFCFGCVPILGVARGSVVASGSRLRGVVCWRQRVAL